MCLSSTWGSLTSTDMKGDEIMKKVMTLFIGLSALIAAIGLNGCSQGGSSGGGSVTRSYQGAGSKWTVDFGSGTFTIKKFATATATAADITVEGTFTDYSSGFRRLTVTNATGAGSPAVGAEAIGIEIPGFAFILKPLGDANAEPIVMVQGGNCPSTNFQGNWVSTDFEAGSNLNDSQDAFGTANFTINGASSSAVITRRTFLTATAMTDSSLSFNSSSCSGGILDAGGGVNLYLTTAGGALVKTTASTIFAAPSNGSDMTQSAIAATYSGVAFVTDLNPRQFPLKLTIPSSGNASGARLSDVATDTSSSDTFTLSSFSAVAGTNGLFTATITDGTNTGKINCATFTYEGIRTIGCNGYLKNDTGDYDGDSNTTEKAPFFAIMRSR